MRSQALPHLDRGAHIPRRRRLTLLILLLPLLLLLLRRRRLLLSTTTATAAATAAAAPTTTTTTTTTATTTTTTNPSYRVRPSLACLITWLLSYFRGEAGKGREGQDSGIRFSGRTRARDFRSQAEGVPDQVMALFASCPVCERLNMSASPSLLLPCP